MHTILKLSFIWLMFSLVPLQAGAADRIPLPTLDPKEEAELTTYLNTHAQPPEEYITSKFRNHDIVFLGEFHRIRHDPVLVQNLIPGLYKAGVRMIGIEFACAGSQGDIDKLLASPTYEEALARKIFWYQWPFWGFQEYIDILKAAWQFNRSLPKGAPLFRILGLNTHMDWSSVWTPEDRNNRDLMKRVFAEGESDEVMAKTIKREVLDKHEKALIYSGCNHAYTRFHQPLVDEKSGELKDSLTSRMGNRIYALIGDRCFNIFLHSPWSPAISSKSEHVYPVEGMIDALFAKLPPEKQRVGFDVAGSPFGQLTDTTSVWSRSSKDFRLENYCDGWIFQKPLSQYEGCTIPPDWITEANRLEAIAQIANPNPKVKNKNETVETLMQSLRDDMNFKRRFRELY
jgi:hypothetical protein